MARILITGSNSGFGRLAALSLARNGHDVIATMRNPANATALRTEADGLSIEIRALDVCDAASVDAALHDAMTIDVVVNNAGYEVQSAVEQLSDEIFRRQLDTNVVGPMRCIRAVMPAWRRRGSGVIVNVSSIAGRVGSPYAGAYSASKFALEGLTESLHFEVSTAGIRVNLDRTRILRHRLSGKDRPARRLERLDPRSESQPISRRTQRPPRSERARTRPTRSRRSNRSGCYRPHDAVPHPRR
jgi:NAD(P)-dependent dehydrogenase (short-subunit alcohol dehydrogenase family)